MTKFFKYKESKMNKLNGLSVVMLAAGLASCSSTSVDKSNMEAKTVETAHCYDVNVCKGHNDCKTSSNACKGHATCKGNGFVVTSTKACADIGGKLKDKWRGTSSTADFVHCYDVNVCKGHNDCKTSDNACKGHATCKGTGFVSMSAKACEDVGGKAGA